MFTIISKLIRNLFNKNVTFDCNIEYNFDKKVKAFLSFKDALNELNNKEVFCDYTIKPFETHLYRIVVKLDYIFDITFKNQDGSIMTDAQVIIFRGKLDTFRCEEHLIDISSKIILEYINMLNGDIDLKNQEFKEMVKELSETLELN